MGNNEFWAKIDHEHAVKACEGKTIQYNVNSRASGNPGGWEKITLIVMVIFVDGDRTFIRCADGQQRIVETKKLMVL